MYATFAFLADAKIQNLVRKLAWDIHQKYRTGLDASRLPPHISLKQPFPVADLSGLVKYIARLAKSIQPFEVHLTGLELIDTTIDKLATGILWLNVEETSTLRDLHNRLNQELTSRFGDVRAPFDGPSYHFHMSVAIGGQPIETYRRILEESSNQITDMRFTVRELAMFVYDDPDADDPGFMTYKVLALDE